MNICKIYTNILWAGVCLMHFISILINQRLAHLLQHLLPHLPPQDDDNDGHKDEDDGH